MKIQFKSTGEITGNTRSQKNQLSRMIAQRNVDGHFSDSDVLEILEVAKSTKEFSDDALRPLTVKEFNTFNIKLSSLEAGFFEGNSDVENEFGFSIGFSAESVIYDCLNTFMDESYLLVDPETKEIFKYRIHDGMNVVLID